VSRRICTLWSVLFVLCLPLALIILAPRAGAQTVLANLRSRVTSSATAVDGIAYVGTEDGKLHAIRTSDGSSVPGFPVTLARGTNPSYWPLRGRPTVYLLDGKPGIYVVSGTGDVVKVGPYGSIAWRRTMGASWTACPAVTPDGDVYVPGPGTAITRLNAATGELCGASVDLTPPWYFGFSYWAVNSPTNVSVFGEKVYMGILRY